MKINEIVDFVKLKEFINELVEEEKITQRKGKWLFQKIRDDFEQLREYRTKMF